MTRAERRRLRHILDVGGTIECADTATLAALTAALGPGAYHTTILHDDACAPSQCVCEPSYVLSALTPERLVAGEQAEREWRASKSS